MSHLARASAVAALLLTACGGETTIPPEQTASAIVAPEGAGAMQAGQASPFQSDPNNCGAVGLVCAGIPNGYATCSNGTCGFACNAGYAFVTSGGGYGGGAVPYACVSVTTDPNNCGAIGRVCAGIPNGYATCSNGTCGVACNAGYALMISGGGYGGSAVSYTCVNVTTDPNNCGAVGRVCPNGTAGHQCVSGQCKVCNYVYGYGGSRSISCR